VTLTKQRTILPIAFSLALFGAAGCSSTGTTDAAATPGAATASPTTAVAAGPVCPPDVNLMYIRLEENKDLFSKLAPSTTGIEKPTCHPDGWAVARTVVTSADSALVLFKYDPSAGRWDALTAGTDSVCDGAGVPQEIQAKLDPAC
jgi:hypothetical protein